MGRLSGNIASELVFEFPKSVRSDCHLTLEFIPDEHDLLYITFFPECLHFIPFHFLRIGSSLIEEHPANTDEKYNVKP